MSKIHIVFVCLGNICRSPLAEGILKHLVTERGYGEKIMIDSAGTANYHIGERPDPRTIENALKNGVELLSRARQFSEDDFDLFDYIIAMDKSNLYNIAYLENNESEKKYKILKMRNFDNLAKNMDVPDPYYGGPNGFQDVFDILYRSNQNFLEYLIQTHNL
jgi:low molecular weight protein-tyrosine phosphatase